MVDRFGLALLFYRNPRISKSTLFVNLFEIKIEISLAYTINEERHASSSQPEQMKSKDGMQT